MKKYFIVMSTVMILFIMPIIVQAEYSPDKKMANMKSGDVIYFDNTGTDWDNIYIYIWQKSTGDYYKEWRTADELEKVEGTENLYQFVVTDEMDDKYNMLIFKNGQSGDENQTINLGYIEEGFAYKLEEGSGKRVGYWYLYDKRTILAQIEEAKEHQKDKEYYTSESYSNLDDLITQATTESEEELKLLSEQDNNGYDTGKFYIQIDFTLDKIKEIIDNLEVDTTKLEELVDEITTIEQDIKNNYTPSTVENLLEELENAKTILTSPNITINDVKNSIKNINTAKNKLVKKADKTELQSLLEEIGTIDKEKYTTESLKKLLNLTSNSSNILDNEEITQDEVDAYLESLKEAIKLLKTKETTNSNTNINVPKTGDYIFTIISLLSVSLMAIVSIIIVKKKISE